MTIEHRGIRFGANQLRRDPDAPKLSYFIPRANGRDSFDNRMFFSPDLAYLDREGNRTKAGLLVSPDGETFMKKHPGILRELEQGLWTLKHEGSVKLSRGWLQRISEGHQSKAYQLSVDELDLVVKTVQDYTDIDQPYVNEMLQVQEVRRELGWLSEHTGVYLPRILFASNLVSCTVFEEGRYPNESELNRSKVLVFCDSVEQYVEEQKAKGNPIWENILVDYKHYGGDRDWRINNFICRADGNLVWIDPFFHSFWSADELRRYGR